LGYPLNIMGKKKKQNARLFFMLNKAHGPLHCQKWAMLDCHLAQALISAITSPLYLTLHYLEGTLHLWVYLVKRRDLTPYSLKSWRESLLTYRHNPSLLRSTYKNLPSSITLCLVIGLRSITILRRRHKNCSPATPHDQHMFVEGKEQFWSSPWVWDPQIGAKNLFLTLQKLLQDWHLLYRRRTYISTIPSI
jgi:hypothetical protein